MAKLGLCINQKKQNNRAKWIPFYDSSKAVAHSLGKKSMIIFYRECKARPVYLHNKKAEYVTPFINLLPN
jgi:hypothetical protein